MPSPTHTFRTAQKLWRQRSIAKAIDRSRVACDAHGHTMEVSESSDMLRHVEALFTKSDLGSIAEIAASETSVQRRCAFAPFWTYQPPPPLVQPFDVGGLSCCRPPKPAELFQDVPMTIGSIGIYVFQCFSCVSCLGTF